MQWIKGTRRCFSKTSVEELHWLLLNRWFTLDQKLPPSKSNDQKIAGKSPGPPAHKVITGILQQTAFQRNTWPFYHLLVKYALGFTSLFHIFKSLFTPSAMLHIF